MPCERGGDGETLVSGVRYALMSDIHANLPALEAVLADIASRGTADAVYHLGDLVGYGPWPNEVIAALRAAGIPGVAGNYDSTVAMGYKHCGCRSESAHEEALAHRSFAWTLEHTSDESRRYLSRLPFRMDLRWLGGHVSGPTVRLVHGNQVLNTVYVTEDRPDDFLAGMSAAMGAREGDTICFGHTHKPWHRTVGGVQFVNTGSVGRPKDGDPRAGYVVLELGPHGSRVEPHRVPYDVETAARAILASDLPDEFADFLRSGGVR
jgi:predicted phosphodiesterase